MDWLPLLVLTGLVLVYMLVGGAIFMALEQDNETTVTNTASSTFTQFITDNPCVTSTELSNFAQGVITAYDAGVVATSDTLSETNWDYGSSLLFALTVITSIGYGHISPTTTGGQVFFVFYAIIGIPLCATLLSGLGEKLSKPYKKLDKKKFFPDHPKIEGMVKLIVFNSLCFVVFSLIPAAIFMAIEGWSYLESWYYTVVTLTTVGFGDFVPGQNGSGYRVIYRLIVMVWIFCGLAWLAMVLNIAGDYMKSFTTKVGDKDGDKNNENAEETKEDTTTNTKENKVEPA